MPSYHGLPAGRTQEHAGGENFPGTIPLPRKTGWFCAALAGIAVPCWLPSIGLEGISAADASAVHPALLMVGLGVSLAVIVTGWGGIGGHISQAARALIRTFVGVGLLSLAYLLADHLPRTMQGLGLAPGNVLDPGIDLTLAAGALAVALLHRKDGSPEEEPRLAVSLPLIAAGGVLLLCALLATAAVAATALQVFGASLAALGLGIYIWSAARLMRTAWPKGSEDLGHVTAAVAAGVLAELLVWLPGANDGLRMVAGDALRILAIVMLYAALFQQMARGPLMELRGAQSAIQTGQLQLARARRMARLGTWEWRIDSDAVWSSEEVRQMFNIPADKAGMTRSEFEDLLYRDDIPRLRAAAQAALDRGEPYSVDYRILGPDGSPRTMHSEAEVERDANGKAVRLSGIVQDITDRVAVEHALRESDAQIRRMNLELEQRVAQRTRQLAATNKELEAFGYSVSHDLQAPLRRIERYAELLSSSNGARLDEAGRDMLRRIQDASSQTKRLIADMLKLSQITRTELRRAAVDLSALARRVLEQIERGSAPRRVEVIVDPDIVVEADAAMLQILLDNLLGNAWKFTARTESPRIRVGALEDQDGKGFFVADNGAGFDMRYADKLFGAFQRLHSQEDFKGTGIGLAIVQRIVNIHGWQIQASGEAGRGATFTIRAH